MDERGDIEFPIWRKKVDRSFVAFTNRSNGDKHSQLSFEKDLHDLLKEAFLMTYMRSLEGQVRKASRAKVDIEKEVPFWEFIDIEFDSSSKLFKYTCHYYQQPTFPELFKQLVSSPSIKKVDDHINNKEKSFRV